MRVLILAFLLGLIRLVDARSEDIVIASYNLNFANRSPDEIVKAIVDAKPDIVLFQEMSAEIEKALRTNLGSIYKEYATVGKTGDYLAEQFSIFSKHKLQNVQFTPDQRVCLASNHAE